MREVGTRVGAIRNGSDEEKKVYFFGYGVYEGDFKIEKGSEAPAGWISEMLLEAGLSNPRIRLDNGEVVWGCECWWGPEEAVQERLKSWKDAGYSIVDVLPSESREAFKQSEHQDSPEVKD